MLRAFPTLVEAAAQLWSVLPGTGQSEWPGVDPMFRLVAVARGIDRALDRGLWPGQGPSDERLLIMAGNLTLAAEMINQPVPAGQPDPTSGGRGDPADPRNHTMHVLYVTARGVTVGLAEHAEMVSGQLRRDSLRKVPSQLRYDPAEPDAARAMISRLDAFEQIAGRQLFETNRGASEPLSVTDRLASALAVWDIQGHRSLAAHPSPPNLTCAARVQALIATTSGIVAEAVTQLGLVGPAAAERFTTLIDTSQIAWTRAANRWSELINPALRTDPKLLGAASEIRAVLAATTHDQMGWATADVIATRLNLPTAIAQLQLATAAAVDLAHLTRDIALTEATLTGPARAIAMRAQSDVERDVDRGESRYLGVDWVTAGDVRTNRIIPIPDPLRRGLVDAADKVIDTTSQAAAAAAVLRPPEPADQATRNATTTRSREAATPSPPIPSVERPAPSRWTTGV
jgi:hypothetical protein